MCPRRRKRRINWRHLVALAALATSATIAADRLVGLLDSKRAIEEGLVFPPHSAVSYHSVDFQFTASINSLGFRDHEFAPGRSSACRVLAIGDSFTYGWGVSLEDSWPKLVEANLRDAGLSVEVANLGLPGAGPIEYADIAERAIPLLEPHLVIVAVLQGDDLAQSRYTIRKTAAETAKTLYPNLLGIARRIEASSEWRVTELPVDLTWKEQARRVLADFGPQEKRRYGNLDHAIRRAFEAGELNPGLVILGMRYPEYYIQTFDLQSRDVRRLIDTMSRQLAKIRKIADRHRAGSIVVSVPFGIYVSPHMFNTWKDRYRFTLDSKMLASESVDEAIRQAAEGAGLRFSASTRAFREHPGRPLYFELDGHFDPRGHRLYAQQLTPVVASDLRNLPGGCRR